MLPLAEEFSVAIAGGDTNCWEGGLVVSVTAIGETTFDGTLRRDGAQVGDMLLVTGTLGGSRLGKQFDFVPRVWEALAWNRTYDLHAAIDVSDGLALDLRRVCEASRCGAILESSSIPVSEDADQWASMSGEERTPLEHALSDGEDFELLLAVPPETAEAMLANAGETPLTKIGCITAGTEIQLRNVGGALVDLPTLGYEHGT